MQFSSSLAGSDSYDRLSTPKGGSNNRASKSQSQVDVHDKGSRDGLAYTGFSNDILPKAPSTFEIVIIVSNKLIIRREEKNKQLILFRLE